MDTDGAVWSRWVRKRVKGKGTGKGAAYELDASRSRELRAAPTAKRKYAQVCLRRTDGTRSPHLVHALVLNTFVRDAPAGCQCRHLNGDRSDNRLANLTWGTSKENHADRLGHAATRREDRAP